MPRLRRPRAGDTTASSALVCFMGISDTWTRPFSSGADSAQRRKNSRLVASLTWSDYDPSASRMHTLSDTKPRPSALLDPIELCGEVIITRMGQPVAHLAPFQGSRRGFAGERDIVAQHFDSRPGDEARALGVID